MFSPFDSHSANQAACGGLSSRQRPFAPRIGLPLHVTALLLAALCTSCGLVSVNAPPPAASISVVPGSAKPFAGARVQFSAVVQNASNPAVTWQVNTIAGGNATFGTIDSSGMYKAPATVPSQPTVTVTAALQMDPSKTASSSVTIQPDISLSISPGLVSFTPSQSWQFQLSTPGFSNSDAAWSVDGVAAANTNAATGTISAVGLYTAPAAPGIHVIGAKLIANPSVGGTAVSYVTDFPGTLTWRNDNARSGVNSREPALAPATVNSSTFGKLFSCPIDGYAYAQPLYVPNLVMADGLAHNVVFVATENDSVYAFDADQSPCKLLWQTSLIPAGSEPVPVPMEITSGDIAPLIGITGTPAISLSLSNLYVVAKTRSLAQVATYSQLLYALDLPTGRSKIIPTGAPILNAGATATLFSPMLANQRPALLLDNGTVYVAFGSRPENFSHKPA